MKHALALFAAIQASLGALVLLFGVFVLLPVPKALIPAVYLFLVLTSVPVAVWIGIKVRRWVRDLLFRRRPSPEAATPVLRNVEGQSLAN